MADEAPTLFSQFLQFFHTYFPWLDLLPGIPTRCWSQHKKKEGEEEEEERVDGDGDGDGIM